MSNWKHCPMTMVVVSALPVLCRGVRAWWLLVAVEMLLGQY